MLRALSARYQAGGWGLGVGLQARISSPLGPPFHFLPFIGTQLVHPHPGTWPPHLSYTSKQVGCSLSYVLGVSSSASHVEISHKVPKGRGGPSHWMPSLAIHTQVSVAAHCS